MISTHVGIVTGLGEEVGNYFSSLFDNGLRCLQLNASVEKYHINAAQILSEMNTPQNIGDILIRVIQSRPHIYSDLIMIPCNSVHIASPYLKHAFGTRFLPIDQAVLSNIERKKVRGRFLILGTSTTILSGIYQTRLRQLHCDPVQFPPEAQTKLDDFIFNELVFREMDVSHLQSLRDQELYYMERLGADHVLLACTELCFLVQKFSVPLPSEVDSLQALYTAGIERLQTYKNKDYKYAV